MPFHRPALAAALALASLGSAFANTLSYTSVAQAPTLTDWSSFADLQQFNPALGLLQQVTLTLAADLAGTAKAESSNNTPSAITLNLKATLTLARPDDLSAVLVQATPLASQVFNAAARDGVRDYAGPSGITLNNLTSTATASATFSDSATLALFTGTGSLLLPFSATGQSFASGPGNLRVGFTTLAGGYASVSYLYAPQPPVPEPATWALLFAGLGMVGWMARRRQA